MIVLRPADDDVRERLRTEFDTTFFVEAGAGTGKTTTLVDRIVALVAAGRITTSQLVAITFTEAAAAELRARVREGLEKAGTPETSAAAASLEEASIDTIHSFAASMLRTYPLEAGLPPNFDTLDQIEQDLEFRERFRSWFEAAALRDLPSISIKNALLLGLTPDRIEGVARALHEHYDLLDTAASWPAPPPQQALPGAAQLAARLRALAAYRDDCLEPATDRMYDAMADLFMSAERLEEADTEGKALTALLLLDGFPTKIGKKGNWRADSLYRLRLELGACLEEAAGILASRRSEILNGLLKALRDFVLEYAAERRQRGVATFHDLLTWARDLLRDHPDVRARAQARWSRIFIDEFQDTDPLQAEIAFYLAALPDRPFPPHWLDAELAPGKLFLVGDPKQSIYRFRRADIALYQKIQERVGEDVALVQNFRSVPMVIEFVNYHFGAAMHFEPDVQPEYRGLVAEPSQEGGLWSFGSEMANVKQPEIWRREAEDVARSCRLIKDTGWRVRGKEGMRPADWQDICVLIPTRTNLRKLERAFETWGVPYRLESGELIVMTQEVRELVSCLRAIDDPSDQVALVATLRSPAFGCSDAELATWRDSGGRFSYEAPGDGQAPRVRDALSELAALHRLRHELSVPALVETFIDRRLLVAQGFGQPRPRETWRRYRYVAKRARDFAGTGRATLRSFVEWMEGLEREQYHDSGVAAAEEDDRAVRVLTIHGAKGLEFPVVIMTGWGSSRRPQRTQVIPDRIRGRLEVGVGDSWRTPGYQLAAAREKRADLAEAVRLTYVAATRARDHLLLSLWRKEAWSEDPPTQAGAFEESLGSGGLGLRIDLEAARRPANRPAVPVPQPTAAEHRAAEATWLLRRDALVTALGGMRLTTATGLAREAEPEQETDDVAMQRRGRGGTSFGRAVHAVLQVVPFDTLVGLEQLARAQAAAEGIVSRAPAIIEAVRRVGASEPVKAAIASGRVLREVPVGAAESGVVLEGFIDLLYDTPDGLRVVDYKTDNATAAEIDRRFRHYRLQGGAYALLLQLATGRTVAGVDFVFAATGQVRSISGTDLAEVVLDVRSRLGESPSAEEEEGGDAGGGDQGQPEAQPSPVAKRGHDDPDDAQEDDRESDQLQLSWMSRTEQDDKS